MKHRQIRMGINRAQKQAHKYKAELQELKLIVFSDHHRGKRDGADDFSACEATYLKALNYYHNRGYTLLLLGDVEELWENRPQEINQSYHNVLTKEAAFHNDNRLLRVWGNHDDLWRYPSEVKAHFHDQFPDLTIYESVQLTITHDGQTLGTILFLHGHQGTMFSSQFATVSKLFVRYIWRPFQRLFKIPVTTASKNKGLRYKTDYAMDYWASIREKQLIVCGHTHHYIFGSYVLDDEDSQPCYFNTGCCSYGNGNISGLEISNGKIRIIEWTPRDSQPYYVSKAPLPSIFERC